MADKLNIGDRAPSKLSIALGQWAAGASDQVRTLIVRLMPNEDHESVRRALEAIGAEVVSSGAGVIVSNLNGTMLMKALKLPGIVRIEEPAQLVPRKSDGSLGASFAPSASRRLGPAGN